MPGTHLAAAGAGVVVTTSHLRIARVTAVEAFPAFGIGLPAVDRFRLLFQTERSLNVIQYLHIESIHYLASCQAEQSMYIDPQHAGTKFIGNGRRAVV